MHMTSLLSVRKIALAGALLTCLTLYVAPIASAGTRPADVAGTQATCQQKSTFSGSHYGDVKLAQTARSGGFSGNGEVMAVAVALAESQGWTQAVRVDTDCSHDRGLWQISNRWHSGISDAQAFNAVNCARAARTISSGGSDWTSWTTYQNGAYRQFLSRAQKAVHQAG
jgi:hypothetical protein